MGYGKNLKNLLEEKGITVKGLAIKASIAPPHFIQLYNGIPQSDLIQRCVFQIS